MASESDVLNAEHLQPGGSFDGSKGAKMTINAFQTADIVTSGSITYIGKVNVGGYWWITKVDESSGTAFTHANINNNSSITSYADAWINRASLDYGNYDDIF